MNFNVSIKGRVKNFQLQANNSMVPLWEAIVNSIHSIDDMKASNDKYWGKIVIEIIRDYQIENEGYEPICCIKITDNGKGFDDENFKSFMESDTEHKLEMGGKGVGRFSWLKAFRDVNIESVFYKNNKLNKRKFKFDINTTSLNENDFEETKENELTTSITLNYMKEDFKKQFPTKLSQIANEIISHCFEYFLIPNFHSVILKDEYETIDLNNLFNTKITKFSESEINILGKKFSLLSLKVDQSIINKHKVILCANNRSVKNFELESFIDDIESLKLENKSFYLGLINSTFLDENVDSNRLDFSNITQNITSMNGVELISIERILLESTNLIKNILHDKLAPIVEKKQKRISDYINKNSPQYRYLLKYRSDELKKIKANISNEKLEEALYKIKTEFELEINKEKNDLVKTITEQSSIIDYEERFKNLVEKISDSNKSRLADYIIHRKAILDLFEQGMRFDDNDKYAKEAFMHNLIYPMKKTSEDHLSFDEQNLWLVDEKLSYYFYISSDVPFNNNQQEDRPDLMFLDKSIALAEVKNDGTCYDSIVIFELKKPMRDDLKYNNPIEQIIDYKEQIKTCTKKDKDGRYIKVNENTKFYLYVICDVSPNYKNKIKSTYGLTETVDGLGFYRMNENEYLEILSYDKILNDARKRNQILFEKLGI